MLFTLVLNTSGGDRTHNPLLRRQVRYPLRHGGFNMFSEFCVLMLPLHHYPEGQPGIEPGPFDCKSNEKVSCCKFT
jgi:hypothetical protein